MKIGLNFLFPKVNNEVFGGDVVLEQLFWPWEWLIKDEWIRFWRKSQRFDRLYGGLYILVLRSPFVILVIGFVFFFKICWFFYRVEGGKKEKNLASLLSLIELLYQITSFFISLVQLGYVIIHPFLLVTSVSHLIMKILCVYIYCQHELYYYCHLYQLIYQNWKQLR